MQNAIRVPLDSGAFKLNQPFLSRDELDLSSMVWVANGTALNLSITGGSGSDAKANVIVSGGSTTDTSVSIIAGGAGYKVGDVLTINGNILNFTGSITFTVTAEQLNGEGAIVYITRPTNGQFCSVVRPTVADTYTKVSITQIQPLAARKWEFTLIGATATNATSIASAFDRALVASCQRPNQDVDLPILPAGVKISEGSFSNISSKGLK